MATNYDFGIGQKITSQDVDLQSVIGAGEGFRPEESVSKLTGEKVGPKYPALEPTFMGDMMRSAEQSLAQLEKNPMAYIN